MELVKGFHANYKDKCMEYINNSNHLIVSKDVCYMGTGMYFWEHESNARYWQESRKKDRESAIVSAEISNEAVLDLTDDDVCSFLEGCLLCVEEVFLQHFKNRYRNKSVPAGRKLDWLFESFSELDKYDVIKGREYKDKKKENSFLIGTNLTTKGVDMYCVRRSCAILKKEWVA